MIEADKKIMEEYYKLKLQELYEKAPYLRPQKRKVELKKQDKAITNLAQTLLKNGFTTKQVRDVNLYLNGGKGSGNFGHAGRPGKKGGSSDRGGYAITESKRLKNIKKVNGYYQPVAALGSGSIPTHLKEISGLDKEQRKFYNGLNQIVKNKESVATLARGALEAAEKNTVLDNNPNGSNEIIIEADAMKEKLGGYGTTKRYQELRDKHLNGALAGREKEEYRTILKSRSASNAMYQETGDIIHCEAVRQAIDQAKTKGFKVNLLITGGGCASGKGYCTQEDGLQIAIDNANRSSSNELKQTANMMGNFVHPKDKKTVTIIADMPGEQCNARLDDYIKLAGNDSKVVVAQVGTMKKHALTSQQGAIARAYKKGRMVDAIAANDSYDLGAENFKHSAELNKNNPNVSYVLIHNNNRLKKGVEGEQYGDTRFISQDGWDKEFADTNSGSAPEYIREMLKSATDNKDMAKLKGNGVNALDYFKEGIRFVRDKIKES